MERLEAALEKAREQRHTGPKADSSRKKPGQKPVRASSGAWADLQELKLSTRVARNQRITTQSNNALSGPYDMLRSRALRIMGDNDWKRLAITSPNTACGKTTVTANLAISMARQSDLRILVLDMDMRRPALNKLLSHKDRYNLHDVLVGTAEPQQQFLRLGDNLAFGLNYKPAQNPSELLQSNRTRDRLNEIEAIYEPDIIIFDMPPLIGSDDNVGFMQNVDCGILVGAAGETSITNLDTCEKELSELTNVLGVVLNKCRYLDADSGYQYEYY